MKRWFLTALLVYMAPRGVQAQHYQGPVTAATAGAGRASLAPIEGPYFNPAVIAFLDKYYLGASTGLHSGDLAGTSQWGVHVTDSTEGALVRASAGYLNGKREVPGLGGLEEQDVQITLAGRLHPQFAIGVLGHHLIQKINGRSTTNNFNVGVLFTPLPTWGLAFVAYDLMSHAELPLPLRPQKSYAFGTNYLYEQLVRFKADVKWVDENNPERKMSYMLGIESFMRPDFSIRLGYQFDELQERKLYATGFGFEGPKFSLDYGLQLVDGQSGLAHFVDLWAAF